jgi:hypothetical protein
MMPEPRYKNGYMLAVEQIAHLTADLATATAKSDALAVEHAELRAAADALAAPLPSVPGQQLAACRICRATWRIGQPERHQDIEYGVPCPVVAYRRLRGGHAPEGEP